MPGENHLPVDSHWNKNKMCESKQKVNTRKNLVINVDHI